MHRRLSLFLAVGLMGCVSNAASNGAGPAPQATAASQSSLSAFGFSRDEGPLGDGVVYRRIVSPSEPPLVAHIVDIDLSRSGFRFAVSQGDRSNGMEHTARLTSVVADEINAIVAVNASYFLPFAGGSPGGDDFYPHVGDPVNVSGAELAGGIQVSPVETDLDIRVNAIVCFAGVRIRIEDGQTCPAEFTDGVAAGPRLLAGGEKRSFAGFDRNYAVSVHPRTAIGVSECRQRAWIVVVDGRQTGYSAGASLEQLTEIFLDLGAVDAINLDGGGSSTLAHAPASGGAILLNRPIHTNVAGRERPVPNHILLLPAER
jgi:hypothetical protein